MEGDANWSLGFLIGLPLLIAVIVALLVGALLFFRAARNESGPYSERGLFNGMGVLLSVCTLIAIAGTMFGFYPYESQYHQYVTKVGEVEKIESRILGSSDSFQQKFVARFTDGREFSCMDTRCALVKPGDTLLVKCIRKWEYQGSDGYDCAYLGRRVND